jgi:hypothetical protein
MGPIKYQADGAAFVFTREGGEGIEGSRVQEVWHCASGRSGSEVGAAALVALKPRVRDGIFESLRVRPVEGGYQLTITGREPNGGR